MLYTGFQQTSLIVEELLQTGNLAREHRLAALLCMSQVGWHGAHGGIVEQIPAQVCAESQAGIF